MIFAARLSADGGSVDAFAETSPERLSTSEFLGVRFLGVIRGTPYFDRGSTIMDE
jgi:hypothetical protein